MFHSKNIQVFVNRDGHEFKRAKWNWFIRQYWKLSERLMIKNADYVVCDSQNIEKYIQEDYKNINLKQHLSLMEQMLLITVMKKNSKYGLRNMRFQKMNII